MFKVNDYIVYSSSGVYKIVDIRKERDINNNNIEYYILEPAYNNNMTIKTPVNNPKVFMRKTMTKEDVLSLIATMPEIEPIWTCEDRYKNESFKAALRSGESEEWIKLIKTLYFEKQEKTGLGKKLAKTYEDIMQAAEKNLNEEFAVALNISPDEVVSYILERIPS